MEVEKELSVLRKKPVGVEDKKAKPKYHSYSMVVILLCVWLRQQGNCSLRCCSKMLVIMGFVLELELEFPCANTIQNWEKKLGYYRLENKEKRNGRIFGLFSKKKRDNKKF